MDADALVCNLCGRALMPDDPQRLIEVPAGIPTGSPWIVVVCLACFLARRSSAADEVA
jgi:hypothetical protein